MTLRDCCEQMGGEYNEAISRLMNDKLIEKFIQKFLLDPSFGELKEAIENNDGEKAFIGVHTLKGVSANLACTILALSSSILTEALRNTNGVLPESALPLFKSVEDDYYIAIETIQSYFA